MSLKNSVKPQRRKERKGNGVSRDERLYRPTRKNNVLSEYVQSPKPDKPEPKKLKLAHPTSIPLLL
jgi:hypothetical protein